MLKLLRAVWLSALPLGLTHALATPFVADASHTSVYFAASHFDRTQVRGRFGKVAVQLDFDEAGRTGSIDVHIDPASVDSGVRVLDSVLKSAQFFDAEQFPDIRFQSTRFEFDGERLRSVAGKLTMHGVTLPVQLQALRFSCGNVKIVLVQRYVCGGDFQATIQRSTFGMQRYLPDVSDAVQINIAIEASPAN